MSGFINFIMYQEKSNYLKHYHLAILQNFTDIHRPKLYTIQQEKVQKTRYK